MKTNFRDSLDLNRGTKSLAINEVLDTGLISDLIKAYILEKNSDNKIIILDGIKIDKSNPNSTNKYLLDKYPDVKSFYDINDFFRKIDGKGEETYFIIKIPRVIDYEDNLIKNKYEDIAEYEKKREKINNDFEISEINQVQYDQYSKNIESELKEFIDEKKREEINEKSWELFSYVRSITEETENIRLIYIGEWDKHDVVQRFIKSQDSYPFQSNEKDLSKIKFSQRGNSFDFQLLRENDYIENDKALYKSFYDYTRGDILSTLFLGKEIKTNNDIDADVSNIRYAFHRYWETFFSDNEKINISKLIEGTGILFPASQDLGKNSWFNRSMLFRKIKRGDTYIFRTTNYLYDSLLYSMNKPVENLKPLQPIINNHVKILEELLLIEHRVKSILSKFISIHTDLDYDLIPLFSNNVQNIESTTTPGKLLKKHKESYKNLFPNNEWRGKIDTILTFGEIINLLERIFFDIYSINNDTEIKIIIDKNNKNYILKKEDIICISKIKSNAYITKIAGTRTDPRENRPMQVDSDSIKNIINEHKLFIKTSDTKFANIADAEKTIENLKDLKTLRNALAHNNRITKSDIEFFDKLKNEFYLLFSYKY
jgi:hypothetical protein|tara:strand:- start:102 stop:1898 length:1797 start_codon:yes stop_codon:yes gene_type:complete